MLKCDLSLFTSFECTNQPSNLVIRIVFFLFSFNALVIIRWMLRQWGGLVWVCAEIREMLRASSQFSISISQPIECTANTIWGKILFTKLSIDRDGTIKWCSRCAKCGSSFWSIFCQCNAIVSHDFYCHSGNWVEDTEFVCEWVCSVLFFFLHPHDVYFPKIAHTERKNMNNSCQNKENVADISEERRSNQQRLNDYVLSNTC